MWSSVVFYQTPGLEVTACMLLSTKAVYFVLHDGLRRYFSEPLQGRHQGLLAPRSLGPMPEEAGWTLSLASYAASGSSDSAALDRKSLV